VAVVVNEYVDVARAFFDGEEPKIVNAVLDRLARKYRGDQKPGKD
jgi:N utilization substance protein B